MNFLKFSGGQLGRTKRAVFLKTSTGFTAILDKFDSLLEVHVVPYVIWSGLLLRMRGVMSGCHCWSP